MPTPANNGVMYEQKCITGAGQLQENKDLYHRVFSKNCNIAFFINLIPVLKLQFSRITDGKKIIPEIEGLRFICVLLVALSHINNYLMKIYDAKGQDISNTRLPVFLEECGSGVSIFFFISGFILAIPFLNARVYNKKKISLKHYYYRRLTRIEPPYIISLTFFFLVIVCLLDQPFTDTVMHYIASALYMHNIIYDHISTINPVAWSLEIEIQFYLLFPFLAAVFFLKNNIARKICLCALFILSGTLYAENASFFDQSHLDKSLIGYLSIFTAGTITADLYLENINFLSGRKNLLFDIAAFTALYFMITLSGFQSLGYRLVVFCCYLILFAGLFRGKILNLIVTNKIIIIIGGMCYSVYLIHYVVIYVVSEYFTKRLLQFNYNTDLLMEVVILLPCILIASAIFFVLFERPFMNINWPQKVKRYFKK